MNGKVIRINNKKIGRKQPVFIIAEASANYSKSFSNAVKLIKTAKESGAGAVKFQVYSPDCLFIYNVLS
ncbi:MAG: hypothetical protein KAW87_08410 [Candidatus Cloacimonetes bacterium]|nr:hypothetical protein [Candidatus Cloacimonadota bacterium]